MCPQRNAEIGDREAFARGRAGAGRPSTFGQVYASTRHGVSVLTSEVDALRTAQIVVAWAGEGHVGDERRLGWRTLKVGVRLPTKDEHRALRPFFSRRYQNMAGGDFMWESFPPRPLEEQSTASGVHRVDVPSAVAWSEPRFLPVGPDQPEFPADSGIATTSRKRWITDFPPRAPWVAELPWAEHSGLRYIDAWDAYEWCQEWGWISGRFWEGVIGVGSWGAYKNVKVAVRLILDVDLP